MVGRAVGTISIHVFVIHTAQRISIKAVQWNHGLCEAGPIGFSIEVLHQHLPTGQVHSSGYHQHVVVLGKGEEEFLIASGSVVHAGCVEGGTIDGQGPVVADDMVIVNSGYDKFGEIAGNVLLVYRLKGSTR